MLSALTHRSLLRGCLVVLALFAARIGFADVVVATDDVVVRVVVRSSATAQSPAVGSLRKGEQLELIGSVPSWHEVRLPNGAIGYVSKRWTRVIAADGPTTTGVSTAPTFTIDVVDVGTGLAVLVRGADFTLIYDAGSNDDDARGDRNRMLAFLRAFAPTLTVVDHMILSHPHQDHVELLPDLLAAYQVKHVWDSGRLHDICGYRAFLTAVRDEPGLQYHNALQAFGTRDYAFGQKRCYGVMLPPASIRLSPSSRIDEAPIPLGKGASMKILHADGAQHPSPNENSLVVRLDLGSTRVLLEGDAEAGGRALPTTLPKPASIEGSLVACCASELAADVLVAAHHGSKTSSRRAFLDAVGASLFVVSSGPTKYSTVTLPDHEIISELTQRGTLFRTDVNDAGCAIAGAKVGTPNDGQPGGCDNVHIELAAGMAPKATVLRTAAP